MQQTSELWKTLAAQLPNGTAWLEARAKIDNNAYTTNITAPVITRALMDNGLSVGNVVSASCTFGVRTNTDYSRGAEVVVQRRLTDGTQNSEWLTAGIFYIARRRRDYINGVTELECYDKLLRANANLPKYFQWDSSDDTNDPILEWEYGRAIEISANYDGIQADILLKNLARTLDIDLSNDAETNSISGTVHVEETATIRDALSAIAKLNGGNFIVTPGGQLKFVKLRDAYNAASAAENVCVVHGVVGSMDVYEMQEIGSVKYTTQGVEGYYPPGGPASYELTVDIGEVENFEVAEDLWDEIDGYGYQAFTLTGAIYDPATELGDYVRAGANNEIASVLYSETATLGHSFRGDISSPVGEEITDEYPYVSTAEKVERATINYVDKKLEEIDTDFSQENIFNALTNNGAAKGLFMIGNQLYVNMTYAKTGTLVLGGVDNVNGKLEVRNANDALIGEWTNNGISVKRGTIQGPSIRLGGVNNEDGSLSVYDSTGLNLLGKWDNTGVSITRGEINGPSISVGGNSNASGELTVYNASGTAVGTMNNTGIKIYSGFLDLVNGQNTLQLNKNSTEQIKAEYTLPNGKKRSIVFGDGELTIDSRHSDSCIRISPLIINAYCANSNFEQTLVFSNGVSNSSLTLSSNEIEAKYNGYTWLWATTNSSSAAYVAIYGDLEVYGNCYASGSKPRLIKTDDYSSRVLYCYETPSPMFGDVGEGVISDDGKCYIWFDAIFAETVVTDQYQVFLQKYGDGDCWVSERLPWRFIVEGTPGLSFGWEIKTKQFDASNKRLDEKGRLYTPVTTDYGIEAAQHIQDIQKERDLSQ